MVQRLKAIKRRKQENTFQHDRRQEGVAEDDEDKDDEDEDDEDDEDDEAD